MHAFIESRTEMTTETFQAITHLENMIESERNQNTHETVLDKYFK